jgi:ribonuclease HI
MQKLEMREFLEEMDEEGAVLVFSDGACSGNPGPGGWGIMFQQNDLFAEALGGEKETTNNRMELMAAIKALSFLPTGSTIKLETDSKYLKDGISTWIKSWKKNGWKTSDKKPVKNRDLWEELDELCKSRDVSWSWTKGHAGTVGNERADALARQAIARIIIEERE